MRKSFFALLLATVVARRLHAEFVASPIAVLERLYEWLGLELSATTRARFESRHEEHHCGAHGAHRYTAAEYGLSTEAILGDYDAYIRAFDVETGR